MSLYLELGLIGLMLKAPRELALNQDKHPALVKLLNSIGYGGYMNDEEAELKKRFHTTLSALETKFKYYDASELKVNEVLSSYLVELYNDFRNAHREPSKTISMMICALGNKGGDHDKSHAIETWIEAAQLLIEDLHGTQNGDKPFVLEHLAFNVSCLEYIEKILQLLDVFVTSRLGMLAGCEEFAPMDQVEWDTVHDEDAFVMGVECLATDDCECGCSPAMDHALTVIEGMEDILSGQDTYAARYLMGVAQAQNIRLDAVAGNEGEILDTIKDMASKAYDWIAEALKAIFGSTDSADESKKADESNETADTNKKALQAMTDKTVEINDAAKQGILNLAKQLDPSGKMSTLVSGLRAPGDGSRVIDGLLGMLRKATTAGNKLGTKKTKAESALADLKKASSAASSADEKNKEVVAAAKANVQEKIKSAKEALKEAKKEVAVHKKYVAGLQKAIAGINPNIFSKAVEAKEGKALPTKAKPDAKKKGA
jgi:hypothetical protein